MRFDQVIPYDDHLYVHAVEDEDGYAYTWGVGGTVICANKPSGYQIVPNTSTTTSNQLHPDLVLHQGVRGSGGCLDELAPARVCDLRDTLTGPAVTLRGWRPSRRRRSVTCRSTRSAHRRAMINW